jgi:hypothetical protein
MQFVSRVRIVVEAGGHGNCHSCQMAAALHTDMLFVLSYLGAETIPTTIGGHE